jgi:predicted dehydrogenase
MAEGAEAVKVGLVGAGPWAHVRHAPMLAAGPHLTLAGVWARRTEAAAELATKHDALVFEDFDALVQASDAIAFSVPPQVQVELAVRAAAAGKALLLEKPLGLDLAGAERIAAAVAEHGVPSQMMFTWRYASSGRQVLEHAQSSRVLGARGAFILGSLLGGPFATPWRVEQGGYLDLVPHLFDYLDAALGPISRIQGHGDPRGWTGLLLEHEGGAFSEVSISGVVPVQPMVAGVDIYTESGSLSFDANDSNLPENYAVIAEEFARTARGEQHPLDAQRGLYVQRLVESASELLRR